MINTYQALGIGSLDHYTLIVNDAETTTQFYTDILNFTVIEKIPLNTRTGNETDPDMINFILQLPGKENQICVVTQGLNEETMFAQYVKKYGEGIHHIAFRCENIDKVFNYCREKSISLISDEIVFDPVFSLKQFFIDRSYCGVFIEIIERVPQKTNIRFTTNNMAKLANTLKKVI